MVPHVIQIGSRRREKDARRLATDEARPEPRLHRTAPLHEGMHVTQLAQRDAAMLGEQDAAAVAILLELSEAPVESHGLLHVAPRLSRRLCGRRLCSRTRCRRLDLAHHLRRLGLGDSSLLLCETHNVDCEMRTACASQRRCVVNIL